MTDLTLDKVFLMILISKKHTKFNESSTIFNNSMGFEKKQTKEHVGLWVVSEFDSLVFGYYLTSY